MNRFQWLSLFFLLSVGAGFFLTAGTTRTIILSSLLLVYLAVFGLGVAVLRLNFFCRAACRGKPGGIRVALTFDDGPDPGATPAVLSVLARYGLKATFFCIGEKIALYPEIARRIVAEGHTIANHTYHHFWWTNFLRSEGFSREIVSTQRAIQKVTEKTPVFFRPPAGLTNPHLADVLMKNNLTCIGWDVRAFDTRESKDKVVKTIARKARDGSIILLHDAHKSPQEVKLLLEEVLMILKSRGFTFSTLEQLLELVPYQQDGAVEETRTSTGLMQPMIERLAGAGWVKKALENETSLDAMKQRPPARFLMAIALIGISYIIGWPAVAFFSFLAVYLKVPEIFILGPASYLFSHLVFLAGMALAGPDGIKYSRLFMRWALHKFAQAVIARQAPDHRE